MKNIKTIILGTILSFNVMATSNQIESIILYNNYSQINSVGNFKDGKVIFQDIPRGIKKESIIFSKDVDEYSFESKTLNMRDIQLDNLGEYVRIKKEDPGMYSTKSWKAKIIGVGNKLIVKDREGYIYQLGEETGVFYPNFKREIKPSITAKMATAKEGGEINLSYLTSGIHWSAKHIIKMKSDKKISLKSFVVLKNQTGREIGGADATIISGETNDVRKNRRFMVQESNVTGMDSMPKGESINGFYKFELRNKLTLKGNEEKTIPLYEERFLKSELVNNFNLTLGSGNEERAKHSNQTLKFKNVVLSGSLILPKGVVNIYNNENNKLIFIVNRNIGNIGKNEEVELPIGKNIDVYLKTKTELVSITKVNKVFEKAKKTTFYFSNESNKESNIRIKVSIPWNTKEVEYFKTDSKVKVIQTRLNNMFEIKVQIPAATTIQGTMSYKEVK